MTVSRRQPASQTITELRKQLRAWEKNTHNHNSLAVSTGCDAIDALLPDHGVRPGILVEWIGKGQASGANTLSLLMAASVVAKNHPWIIIDPQHRIYLLTLSSLGNDLSSLIMVRPENDSDALWAFEQAIRSEGVSLVWANVERISGKAFRRLRLAVEKSGCIGFLVRPERAIPHPSWANVRLLTKAQPFSGNSPRFHIEVAYSQRKTAREAASIEIDSLTGKLCNASQDHEKNLLPVVSELAHSTARARASRPA